MFLTGFDAKTLNTLYVDKNLRYHGLVQATQRTNRILGQVKTQGNIVCFRNLKGGDGRGDRAFFQSGSEGGDPDGALRGVPGALRRSAAGTAGVSCPTPESVDRLLTEEQDRNFVQAFRKLIRIDNILSGFSNYTEDEVAIDAQTFEDYKSKYLDIRDKVRTEQRLQKVSILNDIAGFEVELIHRDQVNVKLHHSAAGRPAHRKAGRT